MELLYKTQQTASYQQQEDQHVRLSITFASLLYGMPPSSSRLVLRCVAAAAAAADLALSFARSLSLPSSRHTHARPHTRTHTHTRTSYPNHTCVWETELSSVTRFSQSLQLLPCLKSAATPTGLAPSTNTSAALLRQYGSFVAWFDEAITYPYKMQKKVAKVAGRIVNAARNLEPLLQALDSGIVLLDPNDAVEERAGHEYLMQVFTAGARRCNHSTKIVSRQLAVTDSGRMTRWTALLK